MTSDKQANDGDPADQPNRDLSHHVVPADVPVFNCLVYVAAGPEGGVQARVGNLAGLQVEAANEREALAKIIPAFKQQLGELMQTGTPIPWIEPPLDPEPAEQTRFIPVHL